MRDCTSTQQMFIKLCTCNGHTASLMDHEHQGNYHLQSFATYLTVGYDVEEDRWFQLHKQNYSYITNHHERQVSLISDENTETMYMIITRSGYNQQTQKESMLVEIYALKINVMEHLPVSVNTPAFKKITCDTHHLSYKLLKYRCVWHLCTLQEKLWICAHRIENLCVGQRC